MGGFRDHYRDHDVVYPVASLLAGAVVYGLTGSGLVTIATLVVGYGLLVLGLLIPDIDSTQSIIHRAFDRLLTGGILLLIVYWVLASDVGASVGLVVDPGAILRGIPDRFVLVLLIGLLVVWWGYTTSHRGIPHHIGWAAGVAGVIVVGVWFGLPGWDWLDRLAVGSGLAIHFLVGVVAHLDRDGVLFGDGPSFRGADGD